MGGTGKDLEQFKLIDEEQEGASRSMSGQNDEASCVQLRSTNGRTSSKAQADENRSQQSGGKKQSYMH